VVGLDMSVSPRRKLRWQDQRWCAGNEISARLQRAPEPVSADVADVANRPKKRPGRRQ